MEVRLVCMGHDHDGSFCWINLLKGERKIVRELTRKPWCFLYSHIQAEYQPLVIREPCANVRSGCSS